MKLGTFKKLIAPLPDTADIRIGEVYGDETYDVLGITEDSEDHNDGTGYHTVEIKPIPHILGPDEYDGELKLHGDRNLYNTEDTFELLNHENNFINVKLNKQGDIYEVEKNE